MTRWLVTAQIHALILKYRIWIFFLSPLLTGVSQFVYLWWNSGMFHARTHWGPKKSWPLMHLFVFDDTACRLFAICRDHFVYAPSQWETTLQCNVVLHWLGACTRDFVYAPSQWETTLHCNVVPHWVGAYTKWSLHIKWLYIDCFLRWILLSHPGIPGVTLCFCTGSYTPPPPPPPPPPAADSCPRDNFWTTFWISFIFGTIVGPDL